MTVFFIREANSDVTGERVLGEFAGQALELDYALAANAPLAQMDSFITPASAPNNAPWPAGVYTLLISTIAAAEFTVEFWRADAQGNDIARIGAQPATQLSQAEETTFLFSVEDAVGQAAALTDRLKLKLFAANPSEQEITFGVMTSVSTVSTPIAQRSQTSNIFNPFRRGRFLGSLRRAGEGAGYFDEHGVDIN